MGKEGPERARWHSRCCYDSGGEDREQPPLETIPLTKAENPNQEVDMTRGKTLLGAALLGVSALTASAGWAW